MKLRHDAEADAVYIQLSRQKYEFEKDLDPERRIDYSADGSPIGIELLCVSTGINLQSLPDRQTMSRLLKQHRIKVLAS